MQLLLLYNFSGLQPPVNSCHHWWYHRYHLWLRVLCQHHDGHGLLQRLEASPFGSHSGHSVAHLVSTMPRMQKWWRWNAVVRKKKQTWQEYTNDNRSVTLTCTARALTSAHTAAWVKCMCNAALKYICVQPTYTSHVENNYTYLHAHTEEYCVVHKES